MKKTLSVCFLIVVFLAVGCGGGGDGGGSIVEPVTPPSQNPIGTYRLNGFKINYSNGVTVTEKNFTSFSGTLKIGVNSYVQSITLNNQTFPSSGLYSITFTNGTSEGIIHITDETGTYDVSFASSGNLFHTYGKGVINEGLAYEQWDYWEKISDKVGMVSGMVEERDTPSEFKFIGEILIEKNLIVME